MITVIVNPTAGSGLALTVGRQVEAMLVQRGQAHTMLYTQRAGHATELARDAAAQGVAGAAYRRAGQRRRAASAGRAAASRSGT